MNHHYIIGAVKEVEAKDLTDHDIVIYNNEPRNIVALKVTSSRVNVRFDYFAPDDKWDLTLTKNKKVFILGANRVTGLKEKENGKTPF